MNNDAINQLIICPNHHRIIHATNPIFNRQKKIDTYKNGMIEKLSINYHL